MDVLRAVEARRTTGANTICSKGLDRALFQSFAADEVVEIQRCKVYDGAAGGEFGAWTCWAGVRESAKAASEVAFLLTQQ